jgi:hypothetical protein
MTDVCVNPPVPPTERRTPESMSDLPLRRDPDESPPDSAAEHALVPVDADTYAAAVVPHDDAPDECTIFPVDVTEDRLVTTWVSAAEGSFVSLAEMR